MLKAHSFCRFGKPFAMNKNHKNHPDQNRKLSDQENLNAGANYKNDVDMPDSGFAKTDDGTKQKIAKEIHVNREEVGKVEDTGALSGRQDYAGGFAGDNTATLGQHKDMHDTVSDPNQGSEGHAPDRSSKNDKQTKK
jgi:hypothetical protein